MTAYLDTDLAAPDVSEESLKLSGVHVVGDVPDEQAHVVMSV